MLTVKKVQTEIERLCRSWGIDPKSLNRKSLDRMVYKIAKANGVEVKKTNGTMDQRAEAAQQNEWAAEPEYVDMPQPTPGDKWDFMDQQGRYDLMVQLWGQPGEQYEARGFETIPQYSWDQLDQWYRDQFEQVLKSIRFQMVKARGCCGQARKAVDPAVWAELGIPPAEVQPGELLIGEVGGGVEVYATQLADGWYIHVASSGPGDLYGPFPSESRVRWAANDMLINFIEKSFSSRVQKGEYKLGAAYGMEYQVLQEGDGWAWQVWPGQGMEGYGIVANGRANDMDQAERDAIESARVNGVTEAYKSIQKADHSPSEMDIYEQDGEWYWGWLSGGPAQGGPFGTEEEARLNAESWYSGYQDYQYEQRAAQMERSTGVHKAGGDVKVGQQIILADEDPDRVWTIKNIDYQNGWLDIESNGEARTITWSELGVPLDRSVDKAVEMTPEAMWNFAQSDDRAAWLQEAGVTPEAATVLLSENWQWGQLPTPAQQYLTDAYYKSLSAVQKGDEYLPDPVDTEGLQQDQIDQWVQVIDQEAQQMGVGGQLADPKDYYWIIQQANGEAAKVADLIRQVIASKGLSVRKDYSDTDAMSWWNDIVHRNAVGDDSVYHLDGPIFSIQRLTNRMIPADVPWHLLTQVNQDAIRQWLESQGSNLDLSVQKGRDGFGVAVLRDSSIPDYLREAGLNPADYDLQALAEQLFDWTNGPEGPDNSDNYEYDPARARERRKEWVLQQVQKSLTAWLQKAKALQASVMATPPLNIPTTQVTPQVTSQPMHKGIGQGDVVFHKGIEVVVESVKDDKAGLLWLGDGNIEYRKTVPVGELSLTKDMILLANDPHNMTQGRIEHFGNPEPKPAVQAVEQANLFAGAGTIVDPPTDARQQWVRRISGACTDINASLGEARMNQLVDYCIKDVRVGGGQSAVVTDGFLYGMIRHLNLMDAIYGVENSIMFDQAVAQMDQIKIVRSLFEESTPVEDLDAAQDRLQEAFGKSYGVYLPLGGNPIEIASKAAKAAYSEVFGNGGEPEVGPDGYVPDDPGEGTRGR